MPSVTRKDAERYGAHGTLKRCRGCDEKKPLDRFSRHSKARDGLNWKCKDCRRIEQRAYYEQNKDRLLRKQAEWYEANRHRAWVRNLANVFGITVEQYDEMLHRQDHVCAICRRPETYTYAGTLRQLCVDHDHASGRVRGLLCASCNIGLGAFREVPENFDRAKSYLSGELS